MVRPTLPETAMLVQDMFNWFLPETILAQELISQGNVPALQELFKEHPQLIDARDIDDGSLLGEAAKEDSPNIEVIRFLVEFGFPINGMNDCGESVLAYVARSGNIELARWLIEQGADPNISAWPMIAAVSRGNLALVKLFVEHRADINCIFGRPDRTPLSQALDYGHQEVAGYLRSLGAIMPPGKQLPTDTDEEPLDAEVFDAEVFDAEEPEVGAFDSDEIVRYFTWRLGTPPERFALQELIPGKVNIAVWTVAPKDKTEPTIIFTTGMSQRPLTTPEGSENYRYAELVMYIESDWPAPPKLDDSAHAWPWIWLRVLAHFPHENDTWFGDWTVSFANGDPPQPLDASCQFTGFLLATNLGGLKGFPSDSGRFINIINVVPIYAEELALAQRGAGVEGIRELLERFEVQGIGASLRLGRRNALEPT